MKDFFPENLGQKCGCILYTGAHYTWQNRISGAKRAVLENAGFM